MILIGHRGSLDVGPGGGPPIPENSLRAFARAFALGAHEVETDLSLSRDGRVFLQHDPHVTLPVGKRPAASLDFAEVKRAKPEVALLAEALEAFPGRKFVLELKRYTDVAAILTRMRDPAIASQHARLRFISFHRALLLAAKKAFPDISRAFIATSNEGRFDPLVREKHVRQCVEDGTAEICGHWRLIFRGTAKKALEAGLEIGLGPINSEAAVRRCARLGAGRVYTDDLRLVAGAAGKLESP